MMRLRILELEVADGDLLYLVAYSHRAEIQLVIVIHLREFHIFNIYSLVL